MWNHSNQRGCPPVQPKRDIPYDPTVGQLRQSLDIIEAHNLNHDHGFGICEKGRQCEFVQKLEEEFLDCISQICEDYQYIAGDNNAQCLYLHRQRKETLLCGDLSQRIVNECHVAVPHPVRPPQPAARPPPPPARPQPPSRLVVRRVPLRCTTRRVPLLIQRTPQHRRHLRPPLQPQHLAPPPPPPPPPPAQHCLALEPQFIEDLLPLLARPPPPPPPPPPPQMRPRAPVHQNIYAVPPPNFMMFAAQPPPPPPPPVEPTDHVRSSSSKRPRSINYGPVRCEADSSTGAA